MDSFHQTKQRVETVLKPLGLRCDRGNFFPEHFGNWIIQVGFGGPFRRWHGRLISDRGQILLEIYPNAPEDARRALERAPSFSPSLEVFLQSVATESRP